MRKDEVVRIKEEIENRSRECIRHLNEFLTHGSEGEPCVLKESTTEIKKVIKNLQDEMKQLNADNISGEAFQTVYDNINNQGKYLKKTFETEKERFEEKNGSVSRRWPELSDVYWFFSLYFQLGLRSHSFVSALGAQV